MAPTQTIFSPPPQEGESGSGFRSDSRWRLVERILLTNPFQKSTNLHALLSYLAEYSIRGQLAKLTERHVGMAVFGKPEDYSPAEDSAVRVHVRQLRLRLHEYFAIEGRNETLVADIPKGSYVLEFRSLSPEKPAADETPAAQPIEPWPRRVGIRDVLLVGSLAVTAICMVGWYRAARGNVEPIPWPLNAVIQSGQETRVIVSDSNSMLRLLGDSQLTLEQYLQPGFKESLIPAQTNEYESRLFHYISDSELTSFADLVVTTSVVQIAGRTGRLVVRSAQQLDQHDLERGNYIFLGSPVSDPWVSLYADKLNFEMTEDGVGGRMYFRNKKPQSGERSMYDGLSRTGSAGEEYATISLLPANNGRGRVLILQGLRQEGTEALGELLNNPSHRAELKRALHIEGDPRIPVYFEVLVRAQAVAGAPISISIVATRIIPSPVGAH